VDFEGGKLTVHSIKTEGEHHGGRAVRQVPLVAELRAILMDAFELAEPGERCVIQLSRNNLRRDFHAILTRAGIDPWEDVFQTLRRSRETDWAMTYPAHYTAAWLGHSPRVSHTHYLQVPDHV
jgi:hypothetical protein